MMNLTNKRINIKTDKEIDLKIVSARLNEVRKSLK